MLKLFKPTDNVNMQTFNDRLSYIDNFMGNPLEEDIYYYVCPTGSDENGDGTLQTPFKTINFALSNIPKNINGHNVTINIAEGTYNEDIILEGFYGTKNTSDFQIGFLDVKQLNHINEAIVNSISVINCQNILLTDLKATGFYNNSQIYIKNSKHIELISLTAQGGERTNGCNGFYITNNSVAILRDNYTIGNYASLKTDYFSIVHSISNNYSGGSYNYYLGDEASNTPGFILKRSDNTDTSTIAISKEVNGGKFL